METTRQLFEQVQETGLRLNPPVDLPTVERFEAEAGVSLPLDYREFLLNVGNGGMGQCRLLRLSDWFCSYWIDDPRPCMIAQPCVITPEAWGQEDLWSDKTNVRDWEKEWDENRWDPMFGTIAVAEIGCGLFYSLVMTCRFRGRIFSWGDHALNPPFLYPEPNFGEWLKSHLDQILAGNPVHFLDGRNR